VGAGVNQAAGLQLVIAALGERKWKNVSKNRQIRQNLLRKAISQRVSFASDNDDDKN
jgi:hypothetical protein